MTEEKLLFIWRYQRLDANKLVDVEGNKIQVIFPGYFNTAKGPTFIKSQIRIGSILWFGNVEMQFATSLWYDLDFHLNELYQNVILNVVWFHDLNNQLKGFHPPILELMNKI